MKPIRYSFLALLVCVPLLNVGKTQNLTSPEQVPGGLAKSDWASIQAAYEAGRHAFQPIDGGWQARNPGQQWTVKFDARGFLAEPRGSDWQWGLELKAYGFPGARRAVAGVPMVKAEGQRLSYDWDAAVKEWFVNDQRGLEHGFMVKERPAGAVDGPLQFDLAIRGSLAPHLTSDALGVEFRDAAGATVLTYSGLKVWDADGKVLHSRFARPDSRLSTPNSPPTVCLLVEERGARYPLIVDPIAQQAYLKASQVSPSDRFGSSIAISGDTVVVGAPDEDGSATGVNGPANEAAESAGAAYVFVRNGTAWSQQAYLKASQVSVRDYFGASVAISGDTVVIGAPQEDGSATGVNGTVNELKRDAGAAYVFVRSGTTWSQQAYLKAGQVSVEDSFGTSVAVSGDTVVVGAHYEDGSAMGVNGPVDEAAIAAGAACVFVRNGTTWSQQAYLKASQVSGSDFFGVSVAVSGETVVVGADAEDGSASGVNGPVDEATDEAGAAYVFVRSGTAWSQQAYLKASQVSALDFFGRAVAVSGDTVVVGAHFEDGSSTGVNSSANEDTIYAGAAYVFVRSGTTWSQQAYLKASQVSERDEFGSSVAVSGNTVVVGAPLEDGSATGVNGPANEAASYAGAAYVFVRSGTTWSQQAYLKASQVSVGDYFGNSVAVAGDTVVVGAFSEDGSGTGVNGTVNESATAAGAAHVFDGGGFFNIQASIAPVFISPGEANAIQAFGMTGLSSTLFAGSSTLSANIELPATFPLGGTCRVQCSPDLINWFTMGTFDLDSPKMSFANTVPGTNNTTLMYRTVYDQPTVSNPPTSRFLEFPLREPNQQARRSPYTHRVVAMQDQNGSAVGFQAYDGRNFNYDPRLDESVTGFAQIWQPGDDPATRVDLANPNVSVKRVLFSRLNYDEKITGYGDVTHVFYDNHTGYDYADHGSYTVANKPIFSTRNGTLYFGTNKTTAVDRDVGGIWRKEDASHPAILQSYNQTISSETRSQWGWYHAIYIVHDNGHSSWFLHCDRVPGQAGNYGAANDHPGTNRDLFTEMVANGFAPVSKGEVIGYVGNYFGTNGGVGPHLHFGVRKRSSVSAPYHDMRADPYGTTDVNGKSTSSVLWEETPPQ